MANDDQADRIPFAPPTYRFTATLQDTSHMVATTTRIDGLSPRYECTTGLGENLVRRMDTDHLHGGDMRCDLIQPDTQRNGEHKMYNHGGICH